MRWIVLVPLVVVASSGIGIWLLTSKWLEDGLEPKADGTNDYAIVLGAKVKKVISLLSPYSIDWMPLLSMPKSIHM